MSIEPAVAAGAGEPDTTDHLAERLRVLLIVSHVVHYEYGGRLFAYGPYAREIDIWADLFPTVRIAAPLRREPPAGDSLEFTRRNISVRPIAETGGETVGEKIRQLLAIPALLLALAREMRGADAIHVRCPGNVGLLGALVAPLFSPFLVAKYAGQWTGFPGEARTSKLQRAILRSAWWRGPVTVYGRWPNQPRNVVPFFTSLLADDQLERARRSARDKTFRLPLRVVYAGRLSADKNVDVLLSALSRLAPDGTAWRCSIVGDGPERASLERLAEGLGIRDRVLFTGALPHDRVLEVYESSDVLVLASDTEGWPKAIAEAMAFGLVCIGSDRGMVPEMLGEGRGIIVPPRDLEALTQALSSLVAKPQNCAARSLASARWGQRYSLESLKGSLRTLLIERWGLADRQNGKRAPRTTVGVMHVVDTLDAGGMERVAVNLANRAPRAMYRPYLCTTRREGVLAPLVAPEVGRLKLERRGRWDVAAIFRLAAYARRHGIQLLHAHGDSLFIAAAASLLPPRPTLVWHDHYGEYACRERPAWLYRLAARRAAAVVAVNEPLADWARQRLGVASERVFYVPNFVDRNDEPAATPTLPGRRGQRIVCVANLRPQKDHRTLIEAMGRVVPQQPDAHLILVGGAPDGAYRAELASEIAAGRLEGSVTFLGPRDDVAAILKECDVGVLASASEGFPLVLLEYGKAALAAVATRVGQCPEVVDHGRCGVLVPPRSAGELAAALVALLRDPSGRVALGQRLRERVEGLYSPEAVIQQVCHIYDTVRPREPELPSGGLMATEPPAETVARRASSSK